MRRFRFLVPGDDGRPMTFPPSGPYWITGSSETHEVVVAYCRDQETLTSPDMWPDAEQIDDLGEQEIVYTDRFQRPEWY